MKPVSSFLTWSTIPFHSVYRMRLDPWNSRRRSYQIYDNAGCSDQRVRRHRFGNSDRWRLRAGRICSSIVSIGKTYGCLFHSPDSDRIVSLLGERRIPPADCSSIRLDSGRSFRIEWCAKREGLANCANSMPICNHRYVFCDTYFIPGQNTKVFL